MALPKEKKDFLQQVGLSATVIAEVEKNLSRARQSAEEQGIESKEVSDDEPEDDFDDGDESRDEDWDGGDEDAEEEGEPAAEKAKGGRHTKPRGTGGARRASKKPDEKRVNWNSDDDPDEKRVNWNSEDDKPRRRKKPSSKVNWNSDNASRKVKKEAGDEGDLYVTREEVAEAVANVISPLLQGINAMAGQIEFLSKEIADLRSDDEDRLAQTKEVTPTLSLTDMIMRQNPIGKSKARVKENSNLKEEGPVETEADDPFANATMVPFINSLQKQAYSKSR